MKWILIAVEVYAGGAALLLLIFFLSRTRGDTGKLDRDVLWALLIWPFLIPLPVFLIKEAFSRRKEFKRREMAERELQALFDHSIANAKQLLDFDAAHIQSCCTAIRNFKTGDYRIISHNLLQPALLQFWELGLNPFEFETEFENNRKICPAPRAIVRHTRFRQIEKGWFIAMSHEFLDAIQKIDRKLQGRILEAMAEISKDPITIRGDTMKPLSHELSGLWRYRLGDYRLVYQPIPDRHHILLVNFASRGSVYG